MKIRNLTQNDIVLENEGKKMVIEPDGLVIKTNDIKEKIIGELNGFPIYSQEFVSK